ncbi:cytohesin-3 [Danio aesculapii]|uniref:cytohesin-3 n=1 Tax=Danio aesculapii TaxID=1142201 RepID=UPI0024BF8F77|nr:cytohesin-3 [Danio aesculapii]
MKSPCSTASMGTQRKDSFLWGKAPSSFNANDKKQNEVHKHVILDDIKQLRMEIENMMTEIQTMEADDENKNVMRNKRIQCGKKKFNMDPKKGIQYLVDNGLLEWKPESVAEFLYKEEGLNKTAIGNFLGESHIPRTKQNLLYVPSMRRNGSSLCFYINI